jgi:hypothetical protein
MPTLREEVEEIVTKAIQRSAGGFFSAKALPEQTDALLTLIEHVRQEDREILRNAIDPTGSQDDWLLGEHYSKGHEDCAKAVLARFDFSAKKHLNPLP